MALIEPEIPNSKIEFAVNAAVGNSKAVLINYYEVLIVYF